MNLKTIFFDVYQTLISVDDSGDEKAWDVFPNFLNKQEVSMDGLQFQKILNLENEKYYDLVADPKKELKHHNLFNLISTIFLNYNIKIEQRRLLDLIWEFRQSYCSDLKLYRGVKEMLLVLSQKYILSIVSYTQSSYTYKELEKLKIAQYFSHFIFSSDIGYRKTNQEFYKICLRKTKNKSNECLMIGDNYLQDVVTPKKVGLKAILIKNPLANKQNIINDVQPDNIVQLKDIATLPSAIQSIT